MDLKQPLNKKLFSDAEYIEEANKKRDFSFYESVLKKRTAENQSFPENGEECDVNEPQVIVEFDPNQPSTSSAGQGVPLSSATLEDPQGSTSSKTSPFDITPIPKLKKRFSNRGRKICSSTIITSTSYEAQLVEAKKAKEAMEAEQQARNRAQGRKSNRGQGRGSEVQPSRKGKGLVKNRLNFVKNVRIKH